MATFTSSQSLLNTNISGIKSSATLINDIQVIFEDLKGGVSSSAFDTGLSNTSSSSQEIYENPEYTGAFGVFKLFGKSTTTFNPKTFDVTSQSSSFNKATIKTDTGEITVTGTFTYSDSSKGIETTSVKITNVSFLGADNVTKWSATTNIVDVQTYNWNTDTVKAGSGNAQKYTALSTTDAQGNAITFTGSIDYVEKTASFTGSMTGMTLKVGDATISSTGLKMTYSQISALSLTTVSALLPTLLTGADKITAGSGADDINGYLGKDTLAGVAGTDNFVFSTALGKTNIDAITGYSATEDSIQLDDAIFTKLAAGNLNADFFKAGPSAKAADANDYIIYDTKSGKLSYDADGNGSGAAIQFATLTKAVGTIDASEFIVI